MKKIRIGGKHGKGKHVLVDDEDYEYLNQWKWYCDNRGYALRGVNINKHTHKIIRMHRVIMDVPKGLYIDHINHNTLDNRKSNLRICNRSQNNQNQIKRPGLTSRYKGVCWCERDNGWYAQIGINGKQINLGLFRDEALAAKTYDEKAKEYFGEFANPNFPQKEDNL